MIIVYFINIYYILMKVQVYEKMSPRVITLSILFNPCKILLLTIRYKITRIKKNI